MVTRLRTGSRLCTKSMPYAPSLHNFHHIKSCQTCVILCAHGCIMYTGQCPPQGTSLEVSLPPYLTSSHAPPFLLSLAPLLPPPSARFLPALFPSLRPSLPHSFPSSTFPPFLHSRTHPPSHHRFLTQSRCPPSPLSPCSLPPTLPPFLRPSLPPSLHPSLPLILHPTSLLPCLPPCLSALV